jgi:SAM-dependent methyltransferase
MTIGERAVDVVSPGPEWGESITHVHILVALMGELGAVRAGQVVRVLDVGCGNGALLAYLLRNLRLIHPHIEWQLYGLDVADHGVQAAGFLDGARRSLETQYPDISWGPRLSLLGVGERWPYPDGRFDFVLSNQVLEHVSDLPDLFAQQARVLVLGGIGIHLAPVREIIWDGHLNLPVVHWIDDWWQRVRWIRRLSQLGLGKFREHRARFGSTLDDYCSRHSDYIQFWTSYSRTADVLRAAAGVGLRASYLYSPYLVIQNLRRLVGLMPTAHYRRGGTMQRLAYTLVKRMTSVTLVLEKTQSYDAAHTNSPLLG